MTSRTKPGVRSVTAADALKLAIDRFMARDYRYALALTEPLVAILPGDNRILSLAAACARELQLHEKAEQYLRMLAAAQPEAAEVRSDLGMVLKTLGRHAEAEAMLAEAIKLDPQLVAAHVNLGNLMKLMGRADDAEHAYRQALALQPDHVDALFNLGLLMEAHGQHEASETLYRQLLAQVPQRADVHDSLGRLLAKQGRDAEAEPAYREATRLEPGFADAHYHLALSLIKSFRYREALEALRHALDAQPRHVYALNCFGNIMAATGRPDKADMAYRRALEIQPDSADVNGNLHCNLGNLLMLERKFEEAEAHFRRALVFDKRNGYALGQSVMCARQRYSWTTCVADGKAIIQALDAGIRGIPPLIVQALPETDREHSRLAGLLCAQSKLPALLDRPPLVDDAHHRHHERLRIGYLSSDFHDHATMHLLGGVLEAHDRSRFEIYGYSYGPDTQDPQRTRASAAIEHFVELRGMNHEAAAARIAADEIDILVDLKGYTQDARPEISALRPAPVLVSWLGYPGSLGHPRLADYIIGDPIVTPPEEAGHYSETLALMPHCYQPNDRSRRIDAAPTRAEEGLPTDAVVFCSFNQAYKLGPEMFDVWCQLLREVPGSVLWLLDPGENGANTLRKEAEVRGVSAERIVFAPKKPPGAHLARLGLADLALDTYPITSHTTGSDALWAGVPLVTMRGTTFASRVAASLLHSIGLPELVTDCRDAYLDLARRLALDKTRRSALRKKLATRRLKSPLFDTAGFTRDLETLYSRIWADHEKGVQVPICVDV